MKRRDKTLGELFPRAMARWPRTFILMTTLSIFMLVLIGMVCAVHFLGLYGPVYLGAAGFVWIVISAMRGDIRDREDP